jgi:hypothetical protein
LQAEAERRALPVADLVRELLDRGLDEAAAAQGREVLVAAVRQAIRPAENRLAAMLHKSITAAATAMYLHTLALALAGEDAEDLYQKARKKAAEYVRQRRDDQETGGGEGAQTGEVQ